MTWSFHYGEKQIGSEMTLEGVERISDEISRCLAQAREVGLPVWFQMQHDNGVGGIAEERLLIAPGVPICFLEE